MRISLLLFAGWMASAALSGSAQSAGVATKDAQTVESGNIGPLPVFDVSSVKPNNSSTAMFGMRFTSNGVSIHNASLLMIIRASHGMFNSLDDKFVGIPAWAKSKRFDIEAKVSGEDAETFSKLNFDKRQLMVQAMLTDRFKLHAR